MPDYIDVMRQSLDRIPVSIPADRVGVGTATESTMDEYMLRARQDMSMGKRKKSTEEHLQSLLDSALLENENLRSKIEELEDNLKQDRFDY